MNETIDRGTEYNRTLAYWLFYAERTYEAACTNLAAEHLRAEILDKGPDSIVTKSDKEMMRYLQARHKGWVR